MTLIFLLAFSLSMDAFSLSLAYGTLEFSNKKKRALALAVGTAHFIMPILGMSVKHYLEYFFHMSSDIVTFMLFMYIGFSMIMISKKEELSANMSIRSMILFSIAVSVDSFTVSLGVNEFNLLAPLIFSLFSAFFTYLGLYLGAKLHQVFGRIATTLGGVIFIVLAFLYI